MEGRLDFRVRERLEGEAWDADSLRSRVGSFHVDVGEARLGEMGKGLVGAGGTGMLMTGSECCRRGFAASLLTLKRACSSTSRQRVQKSEKNLSSEVPCLIGWKFCVLE